MKLIMCVPVVVTFVTLATAPADAQPARQRAHSPVAIGALPAPISPRSIRLAELAVLRRQDRELTLQITMGGESIPPHPRAIFGDPAQTATSGPLVTVTIVPVLSARP
jgi:hypothetical protein